MIKWWFVGIILTLLPTMYPRECGSTVCALTDPTDLVVFTVATEATDGYKRFIRSAKEYRINVTTLGFGDRWRGGDISRNPGAGQKINLLRQGLQNLQYDNNTLVMFVDSYDVVFTASKAEILKAFRKFDANVVFSTEASCWPDPRLESVYPVVKLNEKRYLNSGGFIGYASQIFSIVSTSHIDDHDDDQLFYTKIYLSKERRKQLNMKLDTRSSIFLSLNGALDEITVKFKGARSYVYNTVTGNSPIVIHGNGPVKVEFNGLSNYLAGQWVPRLGCLICDENTISLSDIKAQEMPRVFMAVFIERPTPFVEEFFVNLNALNYPKSRIDLFIHYSDRFHENDVDNFLDVHEREFNSVLLYDYGSELTDWTARNYAVEMFHGKGCRYFFSIDGDVQLENVNTLRHMIETNRSVIAPMVTQHGKVWSNFWGALSDTGFYRRSSDYFEIINGHRRGIWNVPYISGVYLVHSHRMSLLRGSFVDGDLDSDMAFCERLRNLGIFMYVDNQRSYGHMVSTSNFETNHLHNDLYAIIDNTYTWEKKYIHEDYRSILQEKPLSSIDQPCTDVYWLPIVSPIFCLHLIEEMENFGEWSGGTNEDGRIAGGYENVPTVDIHTIQIGWQDQWMFFLKEYIAPLSGKLFEGYETELRSYMNFVVRYRLSDQYRLHPHSDASTFTINIALNTPGVDYEGGGTRFIRYNCSVTKSRLGWMLVHPGRLTHYHEGLPITNGTRYIMVSFIDP